MIRVGGHLQLVELLLQRGGAGDADGGHGVQLGLDPLAHHVGLDTGRVFISICYIIQGCKLANEYKYHRNNYPLEDSTSELLTLKF